MSEKTDYKKLWRKSQRKIVSLSNRILELENIVDVQGDLIKKLGKDKKESK